MKWEVEKSLELGKKVVAVHSGKQFGAAEPKWVSEHKIKTVPWSKLSDELK